MELYHYFPIRFHGVDMDNFVLCQIVQTNYRAHPAGFSVVPWKHAILANVLLSNPNYLVLFFSRSRQSVTIPQSGPRRIPFLFLPVRFLISHFDAMLCIRLKNPSSIILKTNLRIPFTSKYICNQ